MSIFAIAALRLEDAVKLPHYPAAGGRVSGIADRPRCVWSLRILRTLAIIHLAVTALYRPMASVLYSKILHRPASAASLGIDSTRDG
ncbi:hypothetical protein [Mycobacterium lepromatosis]|uniref:hypothetical protein n=1 Tax=Mycobacterium lepromatosis TaxID=480418 RepID=UPI000A9FCAB1|nr:hypothetical protein [Mycobacterium lepromatosis]